jgi:hypothetical protein
MQTAIGIAAKANYKDNIAIDGISFVNNSFYTTFRDIAVTSYDGNTYRIALPEIPIGIGRNEGVSTVQLRDSLGLLGRTLLPISENQRTFYEAMRIIPNKLVYYYKGDAIFVSSPLILTQYTADVTMISGGDSANLDSTLNVPPDYDAVMIEYVRQQLTIQRQMPVDRANEGEDVNPTA